MVQQNLNPSNIFTNRDGNTLIKEFEGIIENNASIKFLDAVVGFLRASGYFALRPFLDNINRVRVLIGINVDKYVAEAMRRNEVFFGKPDEVKKEAIKGIESDIQKSDYKKEVEEGIFQMVQDLKDKKLELRAHPSKSVHAKIYLLYPENFNQHTFGTIITGSSNLTGRGIGSSEKDHQYEFNIKLTDFDNVNFAKGEFERLWEESEGCEITGEDIENEIIPKSRLNPKITPYEVYIKMLMEYFGHDRVTCRDEVNLNNFPEEIRRYQYQIDAVEDGYKKLIDYNGFYLADVVGLGKTVVATMIAMKFITKNGNNTKILVIYPPAVEHNWKETFKTFKIEGYANFISNGSLHVILEKKHKENINYHKPEEYDLIIVDEAHKFRNSNTYSYDNLQAICKTQRSNIGGVEGSHKKVILISATPIQNSPLDLYSQIQLFQDSRRCTIGQVTNLANKFYRFEKAFKTIRRTDNPSEEDQGAYDSEVASLRKEIIEPITLRRTRTDLKNIPEYSKEIESFPSVSDPISIKYKLTDKEAKLFNRTVEILDSKLHYTRYKATDYLNEEEKAKREENTDYGKRLAGIMKNRLIKRLESSFHAFAVSLDNLRETNMKMIKRLDNKQAILIGAAPSFIKNYLEKGMTDEEIEEEIIKAEEKGAKSYPPSSFKPEFIEHLKEDQELLDEIWKKWKDINKTREDPKFDIFKEKLETELFNKDKNKEGKLVIFTESVATLKYLKSRIEEDLGRTDVLAVSSENRRENYTTIKENFDALAKPDEKKDDFNILIASDALSEQQARAPQAQFNILIASDALSEGINLHRSNVIVHYDTPWNATRLMQRIGRVNRIGSSADTIYNYLFYPSAQGRKQIRLVEFSYNKIALFLATYGNDHKIFSENEKIDNNLKKLFKVAKGEDQDQAGDPKLPFFSELRKLYKENRSEYDRIAKLPRSIRTCRKPSKDSPKNGTIVFIKDNSKKTFYLVDKAKKEILRDEVALGYFKADKKEKPSGKIPEQHFDDVNTALKEFKSEREKIQSQEGNISPQLRNALSLLSALLNSTGELQLQENEKKSIENLTRLVENGTIASLEKKLCDEFTSLKKRKTTLPESKVKVLDIAKECEMYLPKEEKTEAIYTDPEIIVSESFKQHHKI